jgi:hypothetical protein
MDIKTFGDLIDWTRQLHAHLARCLHESATRTRDERAGALLDYLSKHETLLEKAVAEFERQADPKALTTRTCETHYEALDFEGIEREVFDFHRQVMDLYDSLIGKAEIPEAKSLLEELKALEEHEAMRLARQVGRMEDL